MHCTNTLEKLGIAWKAIVASVLLAGAVGCIGSSGGVPASSGADAGDTNRDPCAESCKVGARKCGEQGGVLQCVPPRQGCPEFIETKTCQSGKVCQSGVCKEEGQACSNICLVDDGPRCSSSGNILSCDDHDGDGCLEWGMSRRCPGEKVCNPETGKCQTPNCENKCSQGDAECEGDLIRECRKDRRGCWVLSAGKQCPSGQVCRQSECVPKGSCDDECQSGDSVCAPDGGIRHCEDVDGDPCLEFAEPVSCQGNKVCLRGQCRPPDACQNKCKDGETTCAGNKIATCGNHDQDDCVEFDTPRECSGGGTCVTRDGEASCQQQTTSGSVVINEIFYDALGEDFRAGDNKPVSPTFIEIRGPAGASIGRYAIELVDGNGGSSYTTVNLPANAKLDGDGFAVISTTFPDSFLKDKAGLSSNLYQSLPPATEGEGDAMQNGPDGVVLKDRSGSRVDAVAYGDLSGTSGQSQGEGQPVEPVVAGRSIGRKDKTDTDNNRDDFTSYFPTPGMKNSDLMINEAYVDPPGTDSGVHTFVEVASPITSWENISLDGYSLHAINGKDGKNYIFTGATRRPGIPLGANKLHDSPADSGYLLVCNNMAGPGLAPKCGVQYEGVDFQNGPDNFVLKYKGRTVDALGYGTFSESDTFVGEGESIGFTEQDAGKSLTRWPLGNLFLETDSDSNFNDFWLTSPTPGTVNEAP